MVKIFESSIRDVSFGKNVKVIEPVNIYECNISDNVSIGPFVEIQKESQSVKILRFNPMLSFVS